MPNGFRFAASARDWVKIRKKTEKYREKSVENKYIHGYKSQAKSICSMNIFLIVYASDF